MAEMRGGTKAGRPKGAVNKKTAAAIAAASLGITPLEYMLRVLHDEGAPPEDRQWAAEKAAPYVHAKLTSVEQKLSGEVTIKEIRNVIVDPNA